jgi:hypothetical protein
VDIAFWRIFSNALFVDNMLGFHRRTRSLIPVKDLAKYDIVTAEEEEEEQEQYGEEEGAMGGAVADGADKSRQRQLLLVYIVVFAEA